jgi:hypothetical protein
VDPEDAHDARDPQDTLACLLVPWRVGGKVARNVYAVLKDGDQLIGQFDSGMLAREAVYRHNDAHGFR